MVSLDHPHADVLNHAIVNEKEKDMRLRDEVRSRATGAFQCGDMGSAELLFSKAIEIHPEAVLYSNRSMVRLKMGRNELALKDAEKALELDSTFVKAYYRKALALKRLSKFDQAIDTCKKEIVKDVPEIVALIPEIEQDKKKAELEKAAFKAEAEDLTIKRAVPEPTRVPITPPKRTASKEKEEVDDDDDKKPVKQSNMRGYKVTEDGKKTSYFHTDISDEAKKLIGDRRPQKIEPVETKADSDSPRVKSAWNESTFEAKGYNKWVEKKVVEVFPLKHSLHNGEFECVCSYSSFEGDLEIITMRGKPRVVNNVSYTFNWKLYNKDEDQIADGTLIYHNDGNAEYDTECKSGSIKPEARDLVNTYIRKEGSVVQNALMKKVESIMVDFRATEARGVA